MPINSLIQNAIIPLLLKDLMESLVKQKPELESNYINEIKIAQEAVENVINFNLKMRKKLDSISRQMIRYFVQNEFSICKALLVVSGLAIRLIEKEKLYINSDSGLFGLLYRISESVDKAQKEVPDFDKMDSSAWKHVDRLEKLLQEKGYFV